jgi:hypothetical protein
LAFQNGMMCTSLIHRLGRHAAYDPCAPRRCKQSC